jgi:hypothetical protein
METTTGNRTRRFSRVFVVGLATVAVLAPSATAYPDGYNPAYDVRRLDDSRSVSSKPRFVIDMHVPAGTMTTSEVRTSGDSNLRSVAIGFGGAAALMLGLVLAAARVNRLRSAYP